MRPQQVGKSNIRPRKIPKNLRCTIVDTPRQKIKFTAFERGDIKKALGYLSICQKNTKIPRRIDNIHFLHYNDTI